MEEVLAIDEADDSPGQPLHDQARQIEITPSEAVAG